MKDLLLAFLGKTLNLPTEQLAELLYKKSDDGTMTEDLNEGALTQLLAMDSERVGKLKPNTKEYFDNGYKAAEVAVSSKWEKTLREKFGVDADGQLKGDALADAIKSTLADASMKPDKVKLSAEYLALEKQMREQVEATKSEYEKQIEAMKAEAQRDKLWGSASGEIRNALKSLNPVLPSDPMKANRMIDLFMQEFRGFDYQQDEAGFIPLKDGKRVEDAHGYPRKLADLVKERAESMFDFAQQQAAGNAGNENGGSRTVTKTFKDENDFYKAQAEAGNDPTKLKEIATAWKAQQATATN